MKRFELWNKNFERVELDEQVSSINEKDFLRLMRDVYNSGDERLVRNILELGGNLQVEDVAKRIFQEKLPKAEKGAEQTLVRKIVGLGISQEEKVKLINGIESGEAYDIKKMLKSAHKTPYELSSMVSGSFKGADELLPWFVDWTAKPDAGTRGKASTEIFIIAAGKNGKTPPKGDCMVDGITIESKSTKGAFATEYSISGKQSSFKEPVQKFQAELSKMFTSYSIKVPKDTSKLGLGSGKKSATLNATTSQKHSGPLQNTVKLFSDSGMRDAQIETVLTKCIKAGFPLAKSVKKLSFMNKGQIDLRKFYVLWNAYAFEEYKAEEGFDVMAVFNRKKGQVITFYKGSDLIDVEARIRPGLITYAVGAGQNKSIGGFVLS